MSHGESNRDASTVQPPVGDYHAPPGASCFDDREAAAEGAANGAICVCQLCKGRLIEIRGKLQCERCHTIWETCCEGGRWE
jgi:hypothetical protein